MYVAVDYETYYDAEYSVRDLGPRAYTLDPRFEAPLVSVYGYTRGGTVVVASCPPEDFDWELIRGCEWVSWNTGFDSTIHRRLVEQGKVPFSPEVWHDASHLSVFLCAGRSLKDASENLLGVALSKDVRDSMKGVHYSGLNAVEKKAWKDYALKDSELCYQIWDEFHEKWPQAEKDISLHTLRMCERGIYVDVPRAKRYEKALISGLKKVEKEIPWVGKSNPKGVPFPVTSPKQIAIYCEAAGIPKPKTTNAKDPKFEKWFNDYGDRAEFVKSVQLWRKYNKLLKTVQTILTRTEPDGRMEYGLFYFGAHTGRWSGAGGLNMQNLHRDPIKVGRTSVNIRSLLVPKKGTKFAIVDFAQIECRIIFYLSGDNEFLDKCSDKSPYQAHAEVTMGWSNGNLKKDNPQLYQLAKARCLGLGFGCGAAKFVDVARILAGLDITFEEAKKVVQDYRTTNPKIIALWKTLNLAYRKSVNRSYEVELPSGRTLQYFGIFREEGKYGYEYRSSTSMSGHAYKFYGGKLAENLVQGCARDVLRDAILRISEKFEVVLHVHDEVVVEVKDEDDLEWIQNIMRVEPVWLPGLPLDCEGAITSRYMK
jgi:DNA polymerase I-like protein with 3'-5' exonuclease and polymerase domains